jgi:signal peptidase II
MKKNAFVTLVVAGVLVADQLTKWYIRRTVALYESIPVLDSFFHITHVRNPGAAFSFLAGASDSLRIPLFLGASVLAIGGLIYFIRLVPEHQRWLLFGLSGVLGGALGNLIDRISSGQVTDFLLLQWRGYHWPAFNVADSFITVGIGILLVHSFFSKNPSSGGSSS